MSIIYFFVICIFLFGLYASKFSNPYKLNMYIGSKGCGKSTFIAKTAVQWLKKGKTVYVTTPLAGCIYVPPEKIGHVYLVPDSILLVDEVGMIWDNRNFKNFDIAVRDWFKLQRHYRVTVYLFSQALDVDKKLRDLTDNIFIMKSTFNVFSTRKRVIKRLTVTEATGDQPSSLAEQLKIDSFIFFFLGSRGFTFIPKYVHLFDSFEAPELPHEKLTYICPKHKDFIQRMSFLYRIKLKIKKMMNWKGVYFKWLIRKLKIKLKTVLYCFPLFSRLF